MIPLSCGRYGHCNDHRAMHDLHRPTLTPRRRATLGLAAALATLFGAGVVTTIALQRTKQPVVHVAAPAQPMVLPFAVPSLVVLPAALQPEPPAPPPPPPAPEAPPTIAPRALVPTVNPTCASFSDASACTWDTGFPAISADGSTIAIRYVPDDSGRGYPGLSIFLVDTKTSKITKTMLVLSPDEYLDDADDAGWPKLNAKIAKRAAIAQRVLDDRNFRSLSLIDIKSSGDDAEEDAGERTLVTTDATLHAESSGHSIRLVDTAANTVVWQRQFPVEAAYPAAKNPSPDGDGCYPSATSGVGVAWDPQTRTLLATVHYQSGPCYCADEVAYHVTKI